MKRFAITLAALLVSGIALAGSSVTATINSSCTPQNATITVPAGKTASGFTVSALTNGRLCTTGGTPDAKGWGVTLNGSKVYYWNQWQSNAPTETGGPLTALTLGPGTYSVFVDGGSGAQATVSFNLN